MKRTASLALAMSLAIAIIVCSVGYAASRPEKNAPPADKPATAATDKLNFAALPQPKVRNKGIDEAEAKAAIDSMNKGLNYLAGQFEPGVGWSLKGRGGARMFTPAATSLALWAMVQHPGATAETPMIKEGYELLLKYQQPNGAIYNPKEGKANYCTSLAVCALAAAKQEKFKPAIAKAVKYLRSIQITEGDTSRDPKKKGDVIGAGHPYVGGVSYGAKHGRPDLNNVGYWVQALHEAGVKPDDPAMKNALIFISHCQNRSESNNLAWAKKGPNDGGMIYAPAQRDTAKVESKAGVNTVQEPVSYGSISYVGFKSMLYAGLSDDDPRVKALFAWLGQHWTLDKNPGMPPARSQQSLYYYYLAMARGLSAFGEKTIKHDGRKVNWRNALTATIVKRQKPDGSWVNAADRWMEGDPVLVTSYEVLALEAILGK